MAKNQANAKQHPWAELLLFENYSLSSSILPSKTNAKYSKKWAKNKCLSFNEIMWLIIIKTRLKMKNGSQRCEINRTGSRHGYEYIKYKMCLSAMVICNKQYLSNI